MPVAANKNSASGSAAAISSPDRWALVERICSSRQFQKSTRLKDLLRFLCHRAWDEGAEEIKEQEVGVAVFGRPVAFDASQDTLVRVQASQLRKRLESYFHEEGADEQTLLEIPKGGYVPFLRSRENPTIPSPALAGASGTRRAIIILAVLCGLLSIACLWLVFSRYSTVEHPQPGPSVASFWRSFNGSHPTTIVAADSSYAALQDALERPIGIDEYARRTYQKDFDRADLPPQYRSLLRYLMGRRYTSLADLLVTRRVTLLQLVDPTKTAIAYSRDLNVRAFHSGNHILVGSQRAIPWVNLFDDRMDFHMYDQPTDFNLNQADGLRRVWVQNRKPVQGEPAVFEGHLGGPAGSEGFSLVACLPNLSNSGHVLILGGSDMSSTEAAGDLLTTEAFMADLLRRLPKSKSSHPPYFEALLKTRQVEGTNRGFQIISLHPH